MDRPVIERVTIAGHMVAVRRWGEPGRPLAVLIHGIGMSGRYFHPLATALRRRFQVAAPDLPGFGLSGKPARTLTLAEQASVVGGLLERLGGERAVLAGHSMGCQVILELPASAITKFDLRAVLIAPTVNPSEQSASLQLVRLLQDSHRESPELNLILARDYAQCGMRTYLETLACMLGQDTKEALGRFQAPALVIAGSDDPISPPDWCEQACRSLPRGRLVTVSGAHALHFQGAERVADLCGEFARGA